MGGNDWEEIAELLGEAAGRQGAERIRFLEERCAGNPELRAELERFLEEEDAGAGPLDRPPLASLGDRASAGRVGQRLGAYRLLVPIGEGGMGVVYRAERDDGQFSRQVAVKLIGGGIRTAEMMRRFRAEREILARFDHPGITRLLDAGVAGEGTPYLVMELVEGEPFTGYCRSRRLTPRACARLLVRVCRAVHYAHQRLVVHRDLKPSNILVTADGAPKVLDFGIARILEPGAGGSDTMSLLRVLTPNYASPEQIRGEPVSTSSDVYSLGVLLYEVLTGRPPHELTGRPLDEVLGIVARREPAKPSALGFPELRGDADSIVAKALAKAPADRYQSAEDMARDLENWVEDRPVNARPPSTWYLLGKLAVRHKRAVIAAGAGALLLAGSAGTAFWQSRAARRERAVAEQRFEQVRRLANSVAFELHDQAAKIPGTLELRRAMVARSLEYLDALARDAGGAAGLERELAAGYSRLGDIQGNHASFNLGDRKGALASYDKARRLLESLLDRGPDRLPAAVQYGRLLNTISLVEGSDGQSDRTRATARQALMFWTRLSETHPSAEEVTRGLASALFRMGMLESSPESKAGHFHQCLERFEQLLARRPEDPDRMRNVALTHKYLAGVFEESDPARFLAHIQSAERLDARRLASQPGNRQARLDHSTDLGMLATYHQRKGDFAAARPFAERAAAARRSLWQEEPRDVHSRARLAFALQNLGSVLLELGDRKGARALGEAQSHAEALWTETQLPGARETLAWTHLRLGDSQWRPGSQQGCAHYRHARTLFESFRQTLRRPLTEAEQRALRRIQGRLQACLAT